MVSGWLGLQRPVAFWLMHVAISLALAVAVATLSYCTLERFFLRRKARFAHVESQPLPGTGHRGGIDAASAELGPRNAQA